VALFWLAVPLLADAQRPPAHPTPQPPTIGTSARVTTIERGEGEEVELTALAMDSGLRDDKLVRTRGRLEESLVRNPRAPEVAGSRAADRPFYLLTAKNAVVLAIPGFGFRWEDMQDLLGSDLSVVGIVRILSRGRALVDMSLHPDLPPVPDPQPELPRVSITFLRVSRSLGGRPDDGVGLARQILAEPEKFAGKKVTLVGLFRGRNLFADLPRSSVRSASDWVLKDGAVAVWVTGRRPRGDGFSLDPDYEADTTKWLAVTGRVEVADGVVYVKASTVSLTTPPRATAR
jgi:hypothetical protein